MQQIRVNNKFFRSLADAAKFLRMSRVTLSAKMKNKQAITHKDLLIEKVQETPKPKHRNTGVKRATVPVLVDGVAYNSCSEAERAVGLPPSVISKALRCNQRHCCGHDIEPVFPSQIKPIEKKIKVYCETTGIMYDSIKEASKVADVDNWTMSKKMEASGAFIDSKGNIYKRMTPMNTKNKYKDTGKSVKHKREYAPHCVKLGEPTAISIPPVAPKPEVPQVVKDAINDKIIALLKEKGVYDDVIALLEYGGFTSVKFNTNKNN